MGTVAESNRAEAELSLFRLLDPEVLANPYPLFHRLRSEDPVHWDSFLHCWVVTRYSDVVRVLRDFSAHCTPSSEYLTRIGLSALNPVAKVMVKQMLFLDPPAHTRIRSLAAAAFTPQRVEALRNHIRGVARSLLEKLKAKGRMDVIADLAEPLPSIITAEMLGLPVADHRQLKLWSQSFAEVLGNFQHNPNGVTDLVKTTEAMTAYFRSAMRKDKLRPDGLVNSLMHAEIAGDRLSEDEVIANSIITMVGGQETTPNLIGNGVLSLLRHPDQLARLREDPSLIPSAVEELLRFESPSQQTARLAPADVELGGKQISKGQVIRAVMAAANRDPERFPDPDRLDITRADNRHVAFGYGGHFCFGAPLGRLEGQIALEEMVRQFPEWQLEPRPLVWRSNLGLRGLTALWINFANGASQKAATTHNGAVSKLVDRAPMTHSTKEFSEPKRLLLKKILHGDLSKPAGDPGRIQRRGQNHLVPLSLAQEQVWLRGQGSAHLPPFYNESITIHRQGPLDPTLLQRTFTEIIRRHEAWRTSFDLMNGQPVQVIHPPPVAVAVPVVNLQALPPSERELEARRIATEQARTTFDLRQGPLLRAKLITLGENEHRLVLTMHQSIADGITVNTLFPAELATLYEAFSSGKPSPLADLPIQFGDYAQWQRQWMQSPHFASQLNYWHERLTPKPQPLQWPRDASPSASSSYRGAIRAFTINNELVQGLSTLSRQEEVTLFITLLVGFSVLLHYYTNQEDIVLGTLAPSGRKRSEVQKLMGYFLNPVPLRLNLSGDPTFAALLRSARTVVSEAIANDDVPLEYLTSAAPLGSAANADALFNVLISLAPAVPNLGPGWSQTFMDVESGGSRWPLYLELGERPTGLIGRAQFNPDVFGAEAISRLLVQWRSVLETIVLKPAMHVSELNFDDE